VAAFEAHAPDLLAPCRAALAEGAQDLGFFRLGAEDTAAPARSPSTMR
jgi:mannose-1-phosphate guanylyltransferase / mannose-6-phosphate isomerase